MEASMMRKETNEKKRSVPMLPHLLMNRKVPQGTPYENVLISVSIIGPKRGEAASTNQLQSAQLEASLQAWNLQAFENLSGQTAKHL